MNGWKAFVLALVVLIALGIVYGMVVIGRGFSATAQPSAVETVMARTVRNLGIPRSARNQTNPLSTTSVVLQEARDNSRIAVRDATARMATAEPASARIFIPRPRIWGGQKLKISATGKFTTLFRMAYG